MYVQDDGHFNDWNDNDYYDYFNWVEQCRLRVYRKHRLMQDIIDTLLDMGYIEEDPDEHTPNVEDN